jgi:hypothetical protein
MDEKILLTQQIKGMNRQWMEEDIFKKLSPLTGRGYYWDPATLTLKIAGDRGLSHVTPWSHGKGTHKVNCSLDHHVAFELFNIIPPKCLRCYKVCMGLPNFASLMEMEEIQKQLPFACKCGMERRDYTPKHYGAYFYNTSMEEGKDKYHTVVDLITKNMTDGEEIAKGIILKRGCTEYEMIKGPSPFWQMTEKEEEMYDLLTAHVTDYRSNARQPEAVKNFVRQEWIRWAHSNGDFSYLPWNGGVKLYPDYVTYHKGSVEDIQKDLDLAQESLRPIAPPVEYDKEVIGDHDELT